VTGKFSVRTHPAEILFDSGAAHSFISARLVKTLESAPMSKHSLLHIALPDGKMVKYKELLIDRPIQIHGHEFLKDLYKCELTKFDAILAMDGLSKNLVHINCLKQKIMLRGPLRERVIHKGKPTRSDVRLITTIKAKKLFRQGYEGFLCNLVKTKALETSLKDILVV